MSLVNSTLGGILVILLNTQAAQGQAPVPGAARETAAPRLTTIYSALTYDAFPSATLLNNGDIAVAFRVGGDHVSQDGKILLARSSDEGQTWVTSTLQDTLGVDDRVNTGLTKLSNGTVLLPFFRHNGIKVIGAFLLKSADNGKTWMGPFEIKSPLTDWVVPYGRILETKGGTLLLPAYGQNVGQRTRSVLLQSTDGGNTWSLKATIAYNETTEFNETSVVQLDQDSYLAVFREETDPLGHVNNMINLSTSADGGLTWSRPARLFAGVSPDLLRLRAGNILMTVGIRGLNPAVKAYLSTDGGMTWPYVRTLESGQLNAGVDIGYPSSAQLASGDILTAFYYKSPPDIVAAIYNEEIFGIPPGLAPILLTEENSNRVGALDSVTFVRDPFSVVSTQNFSADNRKRIMFFAANLELNPGEDISAVKVQAEDAQGRVYSLTVESLIKVPNERTLTQLNVKLADDLIGKGDVLISLSLHGLVSNKAYINIDAF